MSRTLKRGVQIIGAGVLLGLGYIGTTWARYGKISGRKPQNSLLDRFLPHFEVQEVHETAVGAPASVTFAVAQELDMQQSPLVKAIFAGRKMFMGAKSAGRREPQPLLNEVLALGWRVLDEEPGRHVVVGAVTQPWKADVRFRGLAPEEFAAFKEAGYAKIVWTIEAVPRDATTSLFRTETRVATTDPDARSRFRRYWSLASPGVILIRRELLRLIRREAERRARMLPSPPRTPVGHDSA
jgi:hypothetical protein